MDRRLRSIVIAVFAMGSALILVGCNSGGSGAASSAIAEPGGQAGQVATDPERQQPSAGSSSSSSAAPSGFPVRAGQVGPIAADNARQQPFGCQTQETALGQPAIDNYAGIGYPVTDPGGPAPADLSEINPSAVKGFSANCGAPAQVHYFYRATGDEPGSALHPYDPKNPPSDVATVTVKGQSVPFVVRYEQGTINRFIYAIALLTPAPGGPNTPNMSAWNGDLVYNFGGGVGVGHIQSNGFALDFVDGPSGRDLNLPLLQRGYAVISSTGTVTNTTYNLKLTGETAAMVKRQFVTAYAKPKHTFGVGGSGGAIQQLIYEQNRPNILDGLVPIQTFGDMITEIRPIGACELSEYYFDVANAQVNGTGKVNPLWTDWNNRELIEGLNGINGAESSYDLDGDGVPIGSSAQPGTDECIEGWRGLTPLVLNPHFITGDSYKVLQKTGPRFFKRTRFDFFDDLKGIFGVNPDTGYARVTFDNVGEQYGLTSLKQGKITPKEFLLLNAHIGGFKRPAQDVPPGIPFCLVNVLPAGACNEVDPWSSRNATAHAHLSPDGIAPRTHGNIAAMRAAYKAGLVFRGTITAPAIFIEPYLEPELNMHHSREPFEVRQRMLQAKGNADNMVIWMTANEKNEVLLPLILKAFNTERKWLDQGQKPASVTDACYNGRGNVIAAGFSVFDGQLTDTGADDAVCTRRFPIFKNADIISGEDYTDDIFKCQLKPVSNALADGTYGNVTFTEAQKKRLRAIFPNGVCDYSRPDAGLPKNAG